MRSRLRSDRVDDGDSRTTIASSEYTSASAAMASDPLSRSGGSAAGGSPGSGRGSGASRVPSGTSAARRSSASATSPTMASPIGARAASPGSDVMATSWVVSPSSGPGM